MQYFNRNRRQNTFLFPKSNCEWKLSGNTKLKLNAAPGHTMNFPRSGSRKATEKFPSIESITKSNFSKLFFCFHKEYRKNLDGDKVYTNVTKSNVKIVWKLKMNVFFVIFCSIKKDCLFILEEATLPKATIR